MHPEKDPLLFQKETYGKIHTEILHLLNTYEKRSAYIDLFLLYMHEANQPHDTLTMQGFLTLPLLHIDIQHAVQFSFLTRSDCRDGQQKNILLETHRSESNQIPTYQNYIWFGIADLNQIPLPPAIDDASPLIVCDSEPVTFAEDSIDRSVAGKLPLHYRLWKLAGIFPPPEDFEKNETLYRALTQLVFRDAMRLPRIIGPTEMLDFPQSSLFQAFQPNEPYADITESRTR